jgi:hypothetical protein
MIVERRNTRVECPDRTIRLRVDVDRRLSRLAAAEEAEPSDETDVDGLDEKRL